MFIIFISLEIKIESIYYQSGKLPCGYKGAKRNVRTGQCNDCSVLIKRQL